jgi:hypothetical protein
MTSEWMKVMLEEIERKLKDAEQAEIERTRREQEALADPPSAPLRGK